MRKLSSLRGLDCGVIAGIFVHSLQNIFVYFDLLAWPSFQCKDNTCLLTDPSFFLVCSDRITLCAVLQVAFMTLAGTVPSMYRRLQARSLADTKIFATGNNTQCLCSCLGTVSIKEKYFGFFCLFILT